MKKEWVKPKLVVLVKGKVEENVLQNCKTQTTGLAGPNIFRPRCISVSAPCHTLGAT